MRCTVIKCRQSKKQLFEHPQKKRKTRRVYFENLIDTQTIFSKALPKANPKCGAIKMKNRQPLDLFLINLIEMVVDLRESAECPKELSKGKIYTFWTITFCSWPFIISVDFILEHGEIRNDRESKSINSMKNQLGKECFWSEQQRKKIGWSDLWNYLRNYVNQCIRLKWIHSFVTPPYQNYAKKM